MGDIVAESITSLKPIIEKSKAEIILPDVWPIALGYAPWIEEVWTNYLSNAIKYGGTSPYIEIGTDTDNTENVPEGMVRFWIHDNGPGISADNQKLLFNKFERLDQVKTEGHGLGLSIVRRIIEKLGGQVGMESNKGSLFYFTLPYTGKAEENPTIINEVGGIKKDNKLSNLKVLIAEDEESADKHLSIVLNKISKEILHTKTGIETVDLCRINPDIDLIRLVTGELQKLPRAAEILSPRVRATSSETKSRIHASIQIVVHDISFVPGKPAVYGPGRRSLTTFWKS